MLLFIFKRLPPIKEIFIEYFFYHATSSLKLFAKRFNDVAIFFAIFSSRMIKKTVGFSKRG